MKITKEQEAAIAGMILGDGYLQKTGQKNARLRLEHRADHKDYLIWKTKLLPELFQGQPTFLKRKHPITKKIYSYVRHQSNSTPVLGRLRKVFYPEEKKKIPDNLIKFLKSDIALAIWYFDDGYYYPRDNCAYIYLGRVSRREAEVARDALLKCYDLVTRILDKKQKGFVLYFSPSELKKLKTTVEKYVVPVMAYKINFYLTP